MDPLARFRETLRTRCAWLRTKAMSVNPPQAGDPENPYATAAWWCDRNGRALGPDGDPACDGACDRPGRSCYEPPIVP